MMTGSSNSGLNQVMPVDHMPIKSEFPTTSEYHHPEGFQHSFNILSKKPVKSEDPLTFEYLQSLNILCKKTSERPKNEFFSKAFKDEKDPKEEILKVCRRRGRPRKAKISNSGELVCNLCYYKALDFYDLKRHMRTHQNMYDCSYCASSFSQKGNLMTHIRTHTKEKPFKCLLCDFAASQKVNLQVHLRIHTKEKPFKCSLCDFSTAQKCNLLAHMSRRHSSTVIPKKSDNFENKLGNSESQYRCSVCMYSFKLKKEVLEHIKNEHSHPNCDVKPLVF